MIVFVYAVLVFLVLRFSVTLFNFLSNPKLGYYGKHFTDKVSIIVLSASSETTVKRLLDSIAQQDYGFTEVLVQRGETEEELSKRATGRYLLFLEADAGLQHGLINSLIYRTKVFNLAVLSLVPTQKVSGFVSRMAYALNDFLLLNLVPLRLIRLSNHPAFAAGNSGCLFFDAAIYKRYSWHKKLNNRRPSDLEIVKLVKQQQLKAEILLANKLLYNYAEVRDLNAVAMRLLMHFGNNVFIALIYLVLVIAGPVVVLINFNPVLAVLPFGLIFLSRIMVAFLTNQNPFVQVLLHPLQMVLLFVWTVKAVWTRMLLSIKAKK